LFTWGIAVAFDFNFSIIVLRFNMLSLGFIMYLFSKIQFLVCCCMSVVLFVTNGSISWLLVNFLAVRCIV